MACERAMKRVLLVEDDAASRLFLVAALEAIPVAVACAGSVAEAGAWLGEAGIDLWLVDANLPDGRGVELLDALRANGSAVPALAHTASRERVELDALLAAGFDEVLVKPMQAAQLQATVRRVLGIDGGCRVAEPPPSARAATWDDAAAAAALNGNPSHVEALRLLFLAELPVQRDAVRAALARGDDAEAGAQLHRLQGSCGFVGATRLAAAVDGLRAAMGSDAARARFAAAVAEVLASARGPSQATEVGQHLP
jgi:DNA-binding response OmpR family regulator